MNIDLSVVSKYRSELMGVSAILILCVHAVGNNVCMPPIINSVLTLGQLGVDMFLVLSGIGIYYSLSRWNGNIVDWYKRRFSRLLLPYVCIAVPYYIFLVVNNQADIPTALFRFSTLSFWFRHDAAWFVALLIPLYFFTPLLRKLPKNEYYKWIVLCVIIALSVMFRFMNEGGILSNVSFVSYHVPAYFIGYGIAPYVMQGKTIRVEWFVLFPLLLFVTLHYFNIVDMLLLLFPLLGLLCLFLPLVKCNMIHNSFYFMGQISLESYLTNTMLPAILSYVGIRWFSEYSYLNYGNYLFYALVIIIGISLSVLVNRACGSIKNFKK